jgi:hypothetical protein
MIKGKALWLKFWLGGKFTPGQGKGQEHIDDNISRSPATEEGWISHPAGWTKIKVAGPIIVGGNH